MLSPEIVRAALSRRSIAACRCCFVQQARLASSSSPSKPDAPDAAEPQRSASSVLFESADDVQDEEAIRRSSASAQQEQPWTGDESVRAQLTRILGEQYRPLRDRDYKKPVQQPTERAIEDDAPIIVSSSSEPRAKPKDPWMHDLNFRSPHHHNGVPKVHSQLMAARRPTKAPAALLARDRINAAKEASVDYIDKDAAKLRRAQRSSRVQAALRRAMPTDVTSLVEERIQLSRSRGEFKRSKLHGKPMPQDEHANNVYLDRTSYLMNRMIKAQNAAPPWIELQNELDAATATFRLSLREAWERRALRMLSLTTISPATVEHAERYRDAEWQQREKLYHEESIKQLIDLTRRYNALAPYSVRRGYTDLQTELELCFEESAPVLRQELERRLREGLAGGTVAARAGRSDSKVHRSELDQDWSRSPVDRLWPALKSAVKEVFARR